jgi:hypothetical protein
VAKVRIIKMARKAEIIEYEDEENNYGRTYRLLEESGICKRGSDSFVRGYFKDKRDDRVGVMRGDGSLWIWSPDYYSKREITRFKDLILYCEKKEIPYDFQDIGKLKRRSTNHKNEARAINSLVKIVEGIAKHNRFC